MDPETSTAVIRSWRIRLLVVIGVMAAIATVSVVITLGYGELSPTPLFLWGGVGLVVIARRRVPDRLNPEHAAALGASAAWTALGLVCFVGGPLLISALT